MNVGLPGTGIGGIFYLLSILFLLVAEIVLTARGKSSKERWKAVIEQTGIGLTMIATVVVTNIILVKFVFKSHPNHVVYATNVAQATYNVFQNNPILIPFTLLFFVLLLVQLLRLILMIRWKFFYSKISRT